MAATRRRRLRAGYATVNGFPSYVRGWCCMAKSGSMQRGYRDVGYLLAIRVAEFRPVQFNARLWRRLVTGLSGHVRRNEKRPDLSRTCDAHRLDQRRSIRSSRRQIDEPA